MNKKLMESVGLKEGEKVICLTKGKEFPHSDIDASIGAFTVKDVTKREYVQGEGEITYVYFKEFDDSFLAAQRENVYTKSQLLEMLN